MRRTSLPAGPAVVLLLLLACQGRGQAAGETPAVERAREPLPACEWCGADEAPEELTATMRIAGGDGVPLVVTGTVVGEDGRTPAAGVLIYAYHTDAGGVYPKRGDETGNGRRHGYLRGWLRTGADGRYRIETTRPGSYPSGSEPAHVHMTVRPPGEAERYVDDVVFADDPLLTAAHRARLRGRGGSGVVRLERAPDGTLHARRDLLLGRR